MRLFIAVDIDEAIQKAVGKLQDDIAQEAQLSSKDVKWVRPDLMHLTLKFLGETPDRRVTEICEHLEKAAEATAGFELGIESVGSFGGSSARVLWVGTGIGSDALKELACRVEKALSQAGFGAQTRDFAGHMTLCRIKNFRAGKILKALARDYTDFNVGTTWIDSVCLYQSTLTPEGPVYNALGRYPLR